MASPEDIIRNMLDAVGCAVACYRVIPQGNNCDYQIMEANAAFECLSGHQRTQLIGNLISDDSLCAFFSGLDWSQWYRQLEEGEFENVFLYYADERCYQLSLHCLDKDYLISIFEDISELQSAQLKFQHAFNSTNALECITTFEKGADGIYVDLNDLHCTTIGLEREDIIGHSWTEVNAFDNPFDIERIQETIFRDKRLDNYEFVVDNKRGEKRIGLMSCEIVSINNKNYTFSMIHDITEFRRIERELAEKNQQLLELNSLLSQQVIRDSLTGLYNRHHIFEILNEEIVHSHRYGQTLSLMMMDLDNFKMINDQYGHQIGDSVLRQVALILLNIIRESDRLGRYGGDEFLFILPHTDLDSADLVAKRIVRAIEAGTFSNNIKMKISVGVTSYNGQSLEEFIKRADELMYHAKRNGGNQAMSDR